MTPGPEPSPAEQRDRDFDRLRLANDLHFAEGAGSADASPRSEGGDSVDATDGGVAPRPEPVYGRQQDCVTLTLRVPLTLGTLEIDRIEIREPSWLDVEDITSGRISRLELHARMAGVPVDVLRCLKWSDSEAFTLIAQLLAPHMRS